MTDPGNSTDTAGDTDYFRLDFTEPTHLIIEARSSNLTPIGAALIDAEGREISANIYTLAARPRII